MARKRGTLGYHYVHGLRAAIRFNAQASGFTRTEMGVEPTEVLVAATALSLGSTACGLGAATLVARFLSGIAAWGLAPFVGAAAFLIVLGLEFGLAEELED